MDIETMTKSDESVASVGNMSLITNASMYGDILTKQAELSAKVMNVKAVFDDLIARSEGKAFEDDATLNNDAITYSEGRQELMAAMKDWYLEAARKTVESAVDQAQFELEPAHSRVLCHNRKGSLEKFLPR